MKSTIHHARCATRHEVSVSSRFSSPLCMLMSKLCPRP
jgi:hypothetical protein